MSNARNTPDQPALSVTLLIATLAALFAIGCASPGPPRPPSLNLPRPITDLTAQRIGDKVILQWTTPAKTTDNLPVKGTITAHICRTIITADATPTTAVPPPPPKSTTRKSSSGRKSVPHRSAPAPSACISVLSLSTNPGIATATEPLPTPLTTDPVTLLDYRVELTNAAGHSAGSSNPAYAAAGAAPAAIQSLHATAIPTGIMLEWAPDNPTPSTTIETVELDRFDTTLAAAKPQQPKPTSTPQLAGKETPDVHLRTPVNSPQPSGTLDQTARFSETYRYTAQRVRTLQLNGHILQIRSETSTPTTLTLRDTFPPATPAGLVAIPTQQPPSIDLSWEPNTEPDLAGYFVYRRTTSTTATRLNPTPLPGPGYRDTTATSGQRYTYTVTAIDTSGNESPPTPALEQSLP